MKKFFLKVIMISSILLSGCVSQHQGIIVDKKINHQQKQINTILSRLEEDEHTIKEHYDLMMHNKSVYCYFNANKYSQGSIVSGTMCDVQEGIATWKVYPPSSSTTPTSSSTSSPTSSSTSSPTSSSTSSPTSSS